MAVANGTESNLPKPIETRIEFSAIRQIWVRTDQGAVWAYDPYKETEDCNRVSGLIDEDEGDNWFVLWIEDCFQPAVYLVRADNFQEAYDDFIDARIDELRIDESDYSDYGITEGGAPSDSELDFNVTSDGTPVDTESIQGREVTICRIFQ